MSDDLTIAYQLGVEDMRSKLHKQADEITRLRAQIESAEQAYVRLDASMSRLKAAFRVNMLRAFPHMSHDEIDAEIEAAIREISRRYSGEWG